LLRALRNALSALMKPVTVKYPAGKPEEKYSQIPEGLRGRPEFDEDKCIGCAACTVQCSSGADTYSDTEDSRILEIKLTKCIFCGRCEEICPEEAIRLTSEFELASSSKNSLIVKIELPLAKCRNCGSPITTDKQLARIRERLLMELSANAKKIAEEDIPKYLYLCRNCRRKLSYKLNIHTRKLYLISKYPASKS